MELTLGATQFVVFRMEKVDGVSIRDYVATRRVYGSRSYRVFRYVLKLMEQLCRGLQYFDTVYAEAEGDSPAPFIHQDLKFNNILVTKAGEVKIIDYGAAAGYSRSTETRREEATWDWAAPEQLEPGSPRTRATDVWAIGLLFHRLLLPNIEFEKGRGTPQIPGAPSALTALIDRCLKLEPRNRFRDAGEVLAQLRALHVCVVPAGSNLLEPLRDSSEWQDTMVLGPGEYYVIGKVTCNSSCKILGNGASTRILLQSDGLGAGLLSTANLTLKNCVLAAEGEEAALTFEGGLLIAKAVSFQGVGPNVYVKRGFALLAGCSFLSESAAVVAVSGGLRIHRSTFERADVGMSLHGARARVTGTTFGVDVETGMVVSGGARVRVVDTSFETSVCGIEIGAANVATFKSRFRRSATGVLVQRDSANARFADCRFREHDLAAVVCTGTGEVELSDCTVAQPGLAIAADACSLTLRNLEIVESACVQPILTSPDCRLQVMGGNIDYTSLSTEEWSRWGEHLDGDALSVLQGRVKAVHAELRPLVIKYRKLSELERRLDDLIEKTPRGDPSAKLGGVIGLRG